MSHIHIPDGVLPTWMWIGGWATALVLLWVASLASRRTDIRRKVPLLGVVSALVLVSMSSEIVPIAYHINLTVVAGALLGPWLGVIAAFVVVVVLALIGHGGITVIGLNTLMLATEMALGGALFRLAARLLGRTRVRASAAAATVLTLVFTTTLLVGIVYLSGGGAAATRETGALDPATLRFDNPFAQGVFSINTLRGESPAEAPAVEAPAAVTQAERIRSTRRFAAIVYTLGPLGWLIEAAITAAVLGFVSRVRPGLLFGRLGSSPASHARTGSHADPGA